MNYRIPTLISALTALVLAACSSTPQMPQPLPSGHAALHLATDKDKATLAEPIELAVAFEGLDDQDVSKVEYFADQNKIGEATEAPFNLTWTPQSAGSQINLSAKASLLDGRDLSSEAVSLPVSSASEVSIMAEPVGYTLSVLTNAVSLNQGASTTIPVYIKRTGGYDKEVKLYVGIGTPGVSASFNPSTLTGNQSQSTLTISASHDALAETPRDFLVVSRGIGETKSQFHKLTLTVKGIHGMKVRSAFPGNRLSKVVALPSGGLVVANMVKRNDSGNWRYYGEVLKLNFDLQVVAKVTLPLSNTYEVLVTGLSLGNNNILYVSGCGKTGQYSAAQGFVAAIGMSDFKLINSFGTGGLRLKVMHSSSIYSCANAVHASDNFVTTAGYVNTTPTRIGVAQLDLFSGKDNNTFSSDGTLTTVIPNTNGSVARDVCTLGYYTYVAGHARDIYNRERSVVLNYNYTGSPETSFSGDGIAAFDPDQGSSFINAMDCRFTQLVTAGYANTATGKSNFAVSRLDLGGDLIKSFGRDGMVTTSFGSGKDVAQDVIIMPDNTIVAAGYSTEYDGDRTIAMARYKMDGTLVQGFGIGGKVIEKSILGDTVVTGMTIKSNGNIVVVGYSDATLPQGVIVEYLP